MSESDPAHDPAREAHGVIRFDPATDSGGDRSVRGPRKAALAVLIAAGKILFLAAFLPAARTCNDTLVPAHGFVEADASFLIPPHVFGLVVAIAALLFWRFWDSRLRALEVVLVVLALCGALALAAFFFFSLENVGGVALAALCLALVVSLSARGLGGRRRAARALAVIGLDCTIWYFFWIVLFSLSDDGEDVILFGTYVAAGASVLVFAAARRLEGTVRRWRPRPVPPPQP